MWKIILEVAKLIYHLATLGGAIFLLYRAILWMVRG